MRRPRVRSNGGRPHTDSQGLTVAVFRQTTSRLDDPQLHTHLVISGKVQTDDGRWLALDARVLKHHQRALGGLYQSCCVPSSPTVTASRSARSSRAKPRSPVSRSELLEQFSKRAAQVSASPTDKITEFRQREGRHPSKFEHAALEREAAADTRHRKTGHGVPDLQARWRSEAAGIGVTRDTLTDSIADAASVASARRQSLSPMSSRTYPSSVRRGIGWTSWKRWPIGSARDRECPVNGGRNWWTSRRSGVGRVRRSRPRTRRRTGPCLGRSFVVDRTSRRARHQPTGDRPRRTDPGLGDRRPTRRTQPVTHRALRPTRPCSRATPRRSPAMTGWS